MQGTGWLLPDVAPTLRRCAGHCPPRGLIFLGAARRKIDLSARKSPLHAVGFFTSVFSASKLLHQRNVFLYWYLFGTPLHIKRATKTARFEPAAQGVAQQLAALAESHLDHLTE